MAQHFIKDTRFNIWPDGAFPAGMAVFAGAAGDR